MLMVLLGGKVLFVLIGISSQGRRLRQTELALPKHLVVLRIASSVKSGVDSSGTDSACFRVLS